MKTRGKVIALDVLLLPDNLLLERAKQSNGLLRQNHAAGYAGVAIFQLGGFGSAEAALDISKSTFEMP
jgi:hypothetical protein